VFRGTENNQMAIVDPLYRSAAERRRSSLSMGLEDPEAFIRELDTLLDSDTSEGSQKWSDNDRDLIATTAAAVGRQEDRKTMNSISLRVSPSENYDLTNPDIEMVIEKYKSAMFDSNDVEAWDDGTETNNVTHAEDFSDYNEDPGMDSVFMTRVAVGYGSLLVVVLVAAGAVIGLSMGSSDKPDNIPTGTSDQEKDGTTTTNDPNKKKDDTGDGDDGMTPDGGEDVPVVDDGYTPDGGKANETDDGIYEPEPDEPIEPNDPEEPIKTFDPVGNEDPSPNTNRGFFSPVVIAMLALVGVVVLVGIIGIIVIRRRKAKGKQRPKAEGKQRPKAEGKQRPKAERKQRPKAEGKQRLKAKGKQRIEKGKTKKQLNATTN